ncbi:MAG: transcription-repair coupling factor, partial [Muribaculaceae bacterium]|nr:transcription-repair coupling factor [Muribaculaceae bacterium]
DTDNTAKTGAAEDFVADCTIESDLELLPPTYYVPQDSERIALYQELESIERDDMLDAFEERLRDRFGRIPDVTRELLLVPRLRRVAKRLGIEKVVLKQGSMFLYFVGEENKAYYQSAMFGRLINYVQHNPRRVEIRQRNSRRSFAVANVPSVTEALSVLNTILSFDAV